MIGVIIVVVAVAIGVWIGLRGNTEVREPAPAPDRTEGCDQACQVFQTRQSERCTYQTAAEDAEAYAKSLGDLLQAVGVASVAAAATIIAGFFGGGAKLIAALGPVAAGIVIGGVVALAVGLGLVLAALAAAALTAQIVASNKRQAAIDAEERQTDARNNVLSSCSPEEAEACLNLPSPC